MSQEFVKIPEINKRDIRPFVTETTDDLVTFLGMIFDAAACDKAEIRAALRARSHCVSVDTKGPASRTIRTQITENQQMRFDSVKIIFLISSQKAFVHKQISNGTQIDHVIGTGTLFDADADFLAFSGYKNRLSVNLHGIYFLFKICGLALDMDFIAHFENPRL